MLTHQFIKSFLHYNPETGIFTRTKNSANGRWKAGDIVSGKHTYGYTVTVINGKTHYLHRLAWVYVYGDIVGDIDHINGIRDDNRISNLRLADKSKNAMNTKRRRDNSVGYKGVSERFSATLGARYTARIYSNGKREVLGTFGTPEEAFASYCEAANKHYGEFANHG
jgi:HNH endonuclease